jgi:hypothetical protein
MILVTGGTLVGAHLLLHLIESQSMGNKSALFIDLPARKNESFIYFV